MSYFISGAVVRAVIYKKNCFIFISTRLQAFKTTKRQMIGVPINNNDSYVRLFHVCFLTRVLNVR